MAEHLNAKFPFATSLREVKWLPAARRHFRHLLGALPDVAFVLGGRRCA